MPYQESETTIAFRQWLTERGGRLHPNAVYVEASSGNGLIAREDISANEDIVSCPFDLAITKTLAEEAVSRVLDLQNISWSSRQWICSYIALHWIIGKNHEQSKYLTHFPYIATLPSSSQLLTPLYFTSEELEKFKGTNLYGATKDRIRDWQSEWQQCREIIDQKNPTWGLQFEWKLYLTATTYITSRAFPSTLLSSTPTLPNDDTNQVDPVLLPGVDILNHVRGHPVSWIVHHREQADSATETLTPHISLVGRTPTLAGQEAFNNYGPKPNAELVLGYGFSIPDNPDDTIILKVGGIDGGRKWEIGREANGVEGLWREILETVASDSESNPIEDYEVILDASGALQDMAAGMLQRLPVVDDDVAVRPRVTRMLRDYLEGQTAVLRALLTFAEEKEERAIAAAREAGIELLIEDSDLINEDS